MNALVRQYLQEGIEFEEVLLLSDHREKTWDDLVHISPNLPRGWFELSRVSPEDRVVFMRDFWLQSLPYRPDIAAALFAFFASLDDVIVILGLNGRWTPQIIYSFRDNSCFFHGNAPVSEETLGQLKEEIDFFFPKDWEAFVRLHDGFGKLADTSVLQVMHIAPATEKLRNMLFKAPHPVRYREQCVDPRALVPFFESIGLNSFQCFFADWYPNGEMGNVYFSGIDYTLSDTRCKETWAENGAFPSFLDWLTGYLEGMNVAS